MTTVDVSKKHKKNKPNTWEIVSSIATTILLIVSICVMLLTIISSKTLSDTNDAYIFDYKPYIVNSDSMSGLFEAGDIIVIKKTAFEDIKVGDVITYHSIDPTNYYEILTHKIVSETNYEGNDAFITQGLMNDYTDAYPALQENIVGVYKFHISKAGYFFDFLKTPAGYVVCILVPFLLLLLVQLVNFYKLTKEYKKEVEKENKKAQLKKEEAHQAEMDEMRKQIEALQQQLNNKEK